MSFPFDLDPSERDAGGWATSLLHNAELVLGCLDAVEARSVIEIGAFRGELTRLLMRWAQTAGATVTAVDTAPHADLEELALEDSDLQLVRTTSHIALAELPLADAIILDGDHNYYTVSEELRIISERATALGRRLPLLLLHDVGWPHGRRDDYYVPDRIPAEHRQPLADDGLYPGVPGTYHGGIPCDNPAAREGGPRNGVLTAIEDFVADRAGLRLAMVPAFYGLGVVWDTTGRDNAALERVVSPWDGNPLLARLEGNRVLHLANTHVQMILAQEAEQRVAAQERQLQRQRELLTRMRDSRVLRAAALALRLRGSEPVFSRRQIEQALR
jgi:methyltransferase family protein